MSDSAAMPGESPAPARSVRPRLTSRGGGLLAMSVVAVILGWVMREPGCIHIGLLGLLVLGAGFIWTGSNLRGLSCARTVPESVFAGQPFPLVLTIFNHRKCRDTFAVEFEDTVAGPVESGFRIDWLHARGSATREMQSRVFGRGLLHHAQTRFESMFPLGLWMSRVELESNLEMTVFPRPVPPRMFEDPELQTLLDSDGTESVLTHWDGDFHGLREFQPGDRLKLIHWPTSTRSRHLVVRQFDRRLPGRVTIVFHSIFPDSKPQPSAVFESALELLCGMLLIFRDRGSPVDMIASFNAWQPMLVESHGQLHAALRTLATAKRMVERNFSALHAALEHAEAGHRVIVLSDVPIKEWESHLLELPCVTICLSIQEMFIRQPRMVSQKTVSIVQGELP